MDAVVTAEGMVGRDPELRYTPKGTAVANCSMACSKSRKNQESGEWVTIRTTWYKVTVWGPGAEAFAEQVVKGDKIKVHGWVHLQDMLPGKESGVSIEQWENMEWKAKSQLTLGQVFIPQPEITADLWKIVQSKDERESRSGGGYQGGQGGGSQQPAAGGTYYEPGEEPF